MVASAPRWSTRSCRRLAPGSRSRPSWRSTRWTNAGASWADYQSPALWHPVPRSSSHVGHGSKHVCKIEAFQDVEQEFWTRTGAKWLPNPLFWSVFGPLQLDRHGPTLPRQIFKKNRRGRASKTAAGPNPQNGLFENPRFHNCVFRKGDLQNAYPNFAQQNKWFQKPQAACKLFPDRLLTHKSWKSGPHTNSPAYLYVCIYIYAVELLSGTTFGGF